MNMLEREINHILVQQHVGKLPMIVGSRNNICE